MSEDPKLEINNRLNRPSADFSAPRSREFANGDGKEKEAGDELNRSGEKVILNADGSIISPGKLIETKMVEATNNPISSEVRQALGNDEKMKEQLAKLLNEGGDWHAMTDIVNKN